MRGARRGGERGEQVGEGDGDGRDDEERRQRGAGRGSGLQCVLSPAATSNRSNGRPQFTCLAHGKRGLRKLLQRSSNLHCMEVEEEVEERDGCEIGRSRRG